MRPRPPLQAEEGAQALEFTLVIPALLLLVMVVVAVGQVILGIAGLDHLAALAARTAAVAHDQAVHDLLADAALSEVDITPASGSRRAGDPVTVTLMRQVEVLVLPITLDLTARATFRTEHVP
ncbi:MAG TPA: hypothetical protein VMM13_05345 [Euzebya sp.]|nr:hypothetical protein [Euzebya sp.]